MRRSQIAVVPPQMVISQNRGTPIQTPIYYSPYYGDPQKSVSKAVTWGTPQEVQEVQSTDTDVHQQVALALTNKVPTSIISRDATGILFVGVLGLFWTLGLTYFHHPKTLYEKSAQRSVRGRNGLGRHQLKIWLSCIYARETTETYCNVLQLALDFVKPDRGNNHLYIPKTGLLLRIQTTLL